MKKISIDDVPFLPLLGFGPRAEGTETWGTAIGRTSDEGGFKNAFVYLDNQTKGGGALSLYIAMELTPTEADARDSTYTEEKVITYYRTYSLLMQVGIVEATALADEVTALIGETDQSLNSLDRRLARDYNFNRS